MSDAPVLNEDFRDFLALLTSEGVRFLVVGAHALAAHGIPRATGDLDVFVAATPENAPRVVAALHRFGAPLEAHAVGEDDFVRPGVTYQLGLPPRRIDVITDLSGLTFEDAWATRAAVQTAGLSFSVLGRDALIVNKLAAGRAKDLADVEMLRGGQT